MSYHRAVCALVLSAAVAAGWSEAAARTATSSITTTSIALLDGPKGRKLGHCFLQQNIAAPHLALTGQSATLRAPEGKVVTRVSMKGGPNCFFTPEGATGTWTHSVNGVPCYVVDGLGTQAATVRRVNNGSSCRGLSHLQMLSAAAPAPDAGNGGGSGDNGGGDTGGGDNGSGTGGGGTPGLGSLVVCTAAASPVAEQSLGISVSTRYQEIALLEVPIGSCSAPMFFEEGWYIVAQGLPEGFTLNDVATDPSGRIVSVEAMYGQATVQVLAGSTTKLTFTNQVQ